MFTFAIVIKFILVLKELIATFGFDSLFSVYRMFRICFTAPLNIRHKKKVFEIKISKRYSVYPDLKKITGIFQNNWSGSIFKRQPSRKLCLSIDLSLYGPNAVKTKVILMILDDKGVHRQICLFPLRISFKTFWWLNFVIFSLDACRLCLNT